ncbi:MAG: SurA N-terminal domain-containing protein [Endomicrobium sp.]|jgi:parvulin-like peptidyl-prolyl isomerase|nr:SurA N-terminal domain-containing protein [Endomicrobium sp.]
MKKFVMCIAVLFLTAGSLFGISKNTDKALALINGEPIFTSEFDTLFAPILEEYTQNVPASEQTKQKENELRDAVLNQKISEITLKQEVKKQKIKVSKKEVQDGLDEIKKTFSNESEFKEFFKKNNMSISALEKNVIEQISIKKLLKQNIENKIKMPTEIEARALYDKAIAKVKGTKINLSTEENFIVSNLAAALKRLSNEQVRLRQIFISLPKGASEDALRAVQAKIAKVKQELQRRTFADVAGQYSEDPTTKPRNGEIGVVAKGDIPIESLDKAAFSLKVGTFTKEPIKTDLGYFFFKVEEKRAKKDITFEEIKNDILEFLSRINANTAQNEYIEGLKAKSVIKINKDW